jgi:dienelactone hydrolase
MQRLLLFLPAILCLLIAPLSHAADSRSDFLKLIKRPRVPLSPQVEEMKNTNGLVQFHFSFASDAQQRVPGILIKPDNSSKRRPVVILLHGTGGRKNDLLALGNKFATNGFIAVTIDGRYHGERTKSGRGSGEYQQAIVRAWHGSGEHPFFYDTVWDVMRLVDYLKTRKDVDAKRIGLMGFSKGGIETYLTASADKRIAVVVPCIGVQSFRWALDNNDMWRYRVGTITNAFTTVMKDTGIANPDAAFAKTFYDRIVPGIYEEFDGPAMLPLIAPRPLLVINSDNDLNTPLPGVKIAAEAAEKTYRKQRKEDRFEFLIQERTGHQVRPASERRAIEWFVKWLKP